jgi:hypothetical protein
VTDQRAYLASLKLPPGVAQRLRENARYAGCMPHRWTGDARGSTVCAGCGLTYSEVTDAPEAVVCLDFVLREKAT